jgi:hypothetical protein
MHKSFNLKENIDFNVNFNIYFKAKIRVHQLVNKLWFEVL